MQERHKSYEFTFYALENNHSNKREQHSQHHQTESPKMNASLNLIRGKYLVNELKYFKCDTSIGIAMDFMALLIFI